MAMHPGRRAILQNDLKETCPYTGEIAPTVHRRCPAIIPDGHAREKILADVLVNGPAWEPGTSVLLELERIAAPCCSLSSLTREELNRQEEAPTR